MGKYSKKSKFSPKKVLLISLLALLLAVIIALCIWGAQLAKLAEIPDLPNVTETPSQTEQSNPGAEMPEINVQEDEETMLASGLQIDYVGSYAGIYMEDGSDEIVSDVMMMILTNATEDDLQLARIYLYYPDFVAEFEVTNLPAKASVVLLEKNRHSMVEQEYEMIDVQSVLFFETPMSMMEDTLQIVGGKGYLDVTNISNKTTPENVFIYYKNSATDLLYGGITYRARIEQPIKPGETVRVMTKHYHSESCRLIMVTCGE